MKTLQSLSIFFPAYNDEKTIAQLIKDAYVSGSKITKSLEVIVVNDGSKDQTSQVLAKMKKSYPRLKIVTHHKNKGYGGALQSGFRKATKDWVFYTDGDGQYDVGELTKLAGALDPQTDVVNGYKKRRRDSTLRTVLGKIYNGTLQLFFNLPISDVDCDFRLIRRKCLKDISFTSTSGTFPLELVLKLKKAKARFKEVGVNHYARPYGRSQFFRIPALVATGIGFVILMMQILLGIL